MKKNSVSILIFAFIAAVLCWITVDLMPWYRPNKAVPFSEFSTPRALAHIKEISKTPHYVGSPGHNRVASYLMAELRNMGLQPRIEEGTTLTDWGNLVKSRNIIARIEGSERSKALLLLSHYDSAPHSSSKGAADDASGLAVILEGLRAFLHDKPKPKNDIIVLFSDAEELGLNGAAQFVTQSPMAKDVGLVLNFEARGTAGPGYMLLEINGGNSALVKHFGQADTPHPVANSMMYSIYKMLPNDTDLTVFREQADIPGFNFAFIDDHFNYHTSQDDFAHLSPQTVAHQGSYLMPLLRHFSDANLSDFKSNEDRVYFNTPVGFFHYPFSANMLLAIGTFALLAFFVFIGFGKRLLDLPLIGKGTLVFLGAVATSGMVVYGLWQLLLQIYPHYADMLHGFTYNGHAYIAAFTLLTLACCYFWYARVRDGGLLANYAVGPMLVWLIIDLVLIFVLPGAGYFILPLLFSVLMLGFYVITQRTNVVLYGLFSLPALFLFAPFVYMFPVGLGLKMLAGACVFAALIFGLLLPLLAQVRTKMFWGFVFLLASIGFFIYAHQHSGFEPGKGRPNSLLYVYNADTDKAVWATYDKRIDSWTQSHLGENPQKADALNKLPLFSKYNTGFTYTQEAMVRYLPEPNIAFLRDSTAGAWRFLHIQITPNRPVNRYDIFANATLQLFDFKANGATALGQKGSEWQRSGKKLLSYYVVGQEPLQLEFRVPANAPLDLELLEASFDLLTHPEFIVKKRDVAMIPMPFVLNDAIVIRKKIAKPTTRPTVLPVRKNFSLNTDTDTIPLHEPELNDPFDDIN